MDRLSCRIDSPTTAVRTSPLAAIGLLAVSMCLAVESTGCRSEPAAATNQQLAESERGQDQILSGSERQLLEQALTDLAIDHQPVSPPAPAEHGVRWSDVEQAAWLACNETGVEMAVISTTRTADQVVFTLRTLDDRPARLVATKVDGSKVYSADATVGWWDEDTARAARLLEAFDAALRAFGKKRASDD